MKHYIQKTTVSLLISIVGLQAHAAVSGLILHYKFDETSGYLVADSSGNGFHAKVESSSGWLPAEGKSKGAWDVGGHRYVTAPPAAFRGLTEVTVCCWLKGATDDAGCFRGAADVNNGNGSARVLSGTAGISTNLFYAGYTGNGYSTSLITHDQFGDPSKWEHWAFTAKTNGDMKVYKNGVEVARGTLKAEQKLDGIKSFLIGRTTSNFKGTLDDFRLYSSALTAAELKTVINETSPSLGLIL